MRSYAMSAGLTLTILLAGASVASAEGKGHGLGKAMSAASKGSSASGLNRASQSLSKGSYGKSNGSLNRAAKGLNRVGQASGPALGDAAGGDLQAPLSNQDRILDKRLQQADHLRAVSERNGNERLLETADRMDASAIRNYERQTGQEYQPPVPVDPNTGLPISDPTSPIDPAQTTDAGAPGEPLRADDGQAAPAPDRKSAPQARSSWLPAWLRWGK